jgi:hypothetical protein
MKFNELRVSLGSGFREKLAAVCWSEFRLRVETILAIFCGANSPEVTKDLCKVLLGLEATGYGHVQYPRVGGA